MASLVAGALARVQGFFLEPAPAARESAAPAPAVTIPAPLQVAVIALSRGSGATTVATALSRALAGRPAAVCDVPADEGRRAAGLLDACDVVVCVADGGAEPALCSLVCRMLAARHGPALLVANRVRDAEEWAGRCDACIPDSRFAALLLARGRRPGGAFGQALRALAALVEARS